jgi:hypothetical protein
MWSLSGGLIALSQRSFAFAQKSQASTTKQSRTEFATGYSRSLEKNSMHCSTSLVQSCAVLMRYLILLESQALISHSIHRSIFCIHSCWVLSSTSGRAFIRPGRRRKKTPL